MFKSWSFGEKSLILVPSKSQKDSNTKGNQRKATSWWITEGSAPCHSISRIRGAHRVKENMAGGETLMTELLADVGRENDDTAEVILSKTEMQKKQTLKGIKFSDFQETIKKINEAEYLGIRITIKEELYGYDIPIPEGAKIKPEQTKVKAEKDTIKVQISKETKFNLKSYMMH
ncbi:uncharacterized protein LOC128182306 [Crassostrea angulata]|uniref:uncharacterized protein LOC128182306 n=1 Tax=Magallana angulata TaxID=2784310 RepID=UPI0022B190BB|nr:uncharacterized protein LOC128182306 [Crassostrea angulata]